MLHYAPRTQRSTVTTTRHTTTSTWVAHAQYLQREGAQLESEKGLGWDASGDQDIRVAVDRWREAGDTALYKVIVSPEHGDRLDLREHVRELMLRAARDTGQPLEWVGIEHRNTAHAHVHILVRGVTRDGHETQLLPSYMHSEFQAHSRELATDSLGWRSEREEQRWQMRLALALTKTSLDTELNRVTSRRTRIVNLARTPAEQRTAFEARLHYLQGHGLAQETSRGWRLAPSFTQTLRAIGLAHSKSKSRARGRITPSVEGLPASLRPLARGETVVGVLIDAGRHRANPREPWAVIESTSGELRYLQGAAVDAVVRARAARAMASGTTIAINADSALVIARGRDADAAFAAAMHLRANGLPAPTGDLAGFAGRVQLYYRENPLQFQQQFTKEKLVERDIVDDLPEHVRLHRVLAHTADGVVVDSADGRTRLLPLGPDAPELIAGDIVAHTGAGAVRPYAMGPHGELAKEAVDAQIFADVRATGGVVGRQPQGEELRIDKRNQLAACYEALAAQRTLELISAGVLRSNAGGKLELTEHWRTAYAQERRDAAKSRLPEAAPALMHRGLVREVGAINARGQRGLVVDTPTGTVFAASAITRAYPGQVVELSRKDPQQAWAMRTLGAADRRAVLDRVQRVYKEQVRAQRAQSRARKRGRDDLDR